MTEGEVGGLPTAATVQRILRMVEGTDIEQLELRWGDARIRIVQGAATSRDTDDTPSAAVVEGVGITAPLTGVYYARPAPEQPSFVDEGGIVTAGQVVGLIETMKLFNEIVSEVEGTVERILVAEGDLVEAGQVLMRVLPSAEPSPS